MSSSSLKFTARERVVMTLTGVVLVAAPWGWAGVVLWTVAAALGFATAAFMAVFAEARAQRVVMGVALVGLLAASIVAASAGYELFTHRWLDHVTFPAALFAGSSFAWSRLSRDLVSHPSAEARAELFRSVPFWAGVALFAYFAVQDFNAWGVVVDREAFWAKQGLPGVDVGKFDVRPLPYVRWLPSGLEAPFSAADTTHSPMNAWRLMMILAAPWMLFCALRSGLRRRRCYVWLAWVTVVSACLVGVFGLANQYTYGTILGLPIPRNSRCFGPFIGRNHAGVYLYLHAALALGLTLWHIRRSGANSLQGGPHLVAGFLAFVLTLLAALTGSTAAVAIVLTLLFFSVLLAYVRGFPGVRRFHRSTVVVTGLAMAAAAAAILISVDLRPVVNRFKLKADKYEQTGFDDRMPLRRATWALIEDGGWEGRAWVGYGAGSYRWISPPYQAQQPELHKNGSFHYRADYAHNDWLEMLATWGIIGLLPVLVFLGWLFHWLARAFRRGHPENYPLALGLILLGLHAGFDLLFWFTPLMFTAAFVLAAMTTFTERSSAEKARALS